MTHETEVLRLFHKLKSTNKSLTITDEYTLTIEGQQVVGLVDIYRYLSIVTEVNGFNSLLEKVAA